MALPTYYYCLVLVLLVVTTTTPTMLAVANFDECLKVPGTEFVDSVKSTIQTVRDVISIVSKFSSFGDFRLSNAVADCLDLLDFSADELTWSLSASQNPPNTGTLSSYDQLYISLC